MRIPVFDPEGQKKLAGGRGPQGRLPPVGRVRENSTPDGVAEPCAHQFWHPIRGAELRIRKIRWHRPRLGLSHRLISSTPFGVTAKTRNFKKRKRGGVGLCSHTSFWRASQHLAPLRSLDPQAACRASSLALRVSLANSRMGLPAGIRVTPCNKSARTVSVTGTSGPI